MSDEKSSTPTIVEKVKSKFLQTYGTLRAKGERVELKPGRLTPFLTQTDIGKGLTEKDKALKIILAYAEDRELIGLAKSISARRAKLPAQRFWICKKCGFRVAFGPDVEAGACITCNYEGFKSGGFMREMSGAEVKQWEADKAADKVRILAQMKKEKELLKQDFNLRAARGEFDR